jgi:hypothetical protein
MLLFLDAWNLLPKDAGKCSYCKYIIYFSTALQWNMYSVLAVKHIWVAECIMLSEQKPNWYFSIVTFCSDICLLVVRYSCIIVFLSQDFINNLIYVPKWLNSSVCFILRRVVIGMCCLKYKKVSHFTWACICPHIYRLYAHNETMFTFLYVVIVFQYVLSTFWVT